jgi:hypothetical protein
MSDQDQNPALEDLLGAIKREDGTPKYASPEDAIKALISAQQHIKTLETENASYRENMSKIDSIEATISKLANSKGDNQAPKPEEPEDKPVVDFNQLDELIVRKFQELSQNTVKQNNLAEFTSKVSGDEYISARAKDLDLSVDFIKDLAATSPKAALKLLEERKEMAPAHSTNGERPSKFEKPQERVNVANMSSRERISVIEDRIRQLTSGGN